MADGKRVKYFVSVALMVIVFLLAFFILRPIFLSVLAGLILAYILYPVHGKVLDYVKEKNTSALLVCLFILLVIIIPFWFLMPILTRQTFNAYLYLQKVDLVTALKDVFPFPKEISPDFTAMINNFINKMASALLNSLTSFILNFPNILLHVTLIFFVFFFSLRDGKELISYIKSLSPLSEKTHDIFFQKFKDVTNSVLFGQFVVGIAQGVLAGVGFLIFGVPNALSLTILTVFVGILPVIGPWLVWIPVDIFLFVGGRTGSAVGLLIYGAIVITWVDSIIRPYIVSKKTKINSGVIFVGMIGGLFVFGVLGLLLGPLILAYSLVILDLYRHKKL